MKAGGVIGGNKKDQQEEGRRCGESRVELIQPNYNENSITLYAD